MSVFQAVEPSRSRRASGQAVMTCNDQAVEPALGPAARRTLVALDG
jgi:hypothetical protein